MFLSIIHSFLSTTSAYQSATLLLLSYLTISIFNLHLQSPSYHLFLSVTSACLPACRYRILQSQSYHLSSFTCAVRPILSNLTTCHHSSPSPYLCPCPCPLHPFLCSLLSWLPFSLHPRFLDHPLSWLPSSPYACPWWSRGLVFGR